MITHNVKIIIYIYNETYLLFYHVILLVGCEANAVALLRNEEEIAVHAGRNLFLPEVSPLPW